MAETDNYGLYVFEPSDGAEKVKTVLEKIAGSEESNMTKLDATLKTKADLVDGMVPASQLPSYVDDVVEGYLSGGTFYTDSSHSTSIKAESGKIYVDLETSLSYRWGGSSFVEISPSVAIGETSSTAYRGDRGKVAYDHSQVKSGNPHKVTKTDVGLGSVDNTSDANKPVSTAQNEAISSAKNEAINSANTALLTHNTSSDAHTSQFAAKADLVDGKVPEEQLPLTGGCVAQDTAPENTKLLWIDTANGAITKYWNGTEWVATGAVWG